jgi:hypothetical protein
VTRTEAIQKARASVEKSAHCVQNPRRWLIGVAPVPYKISDHQASEIQLLEGTGPKGYVVVLGQGPGYGYCNRNVPRQDTSQMEV